MPPTKTARKSRLERPREGRGRLKAKRAAGGVKRGKPRVSAAESPFKNAPMRNRRVGPSKQRPAAKWALRQLDGNRRAKAAALRSKSDVREAVADEAALRALKTAHNRGGVLGFGATARFRGQIPKKNRGKSRTRGRAGAETPKSYQNWLGRILILIQPDAPYRFREKTRHLKW